MFGRWRKKEESSGITCPLCTEESPEGTEECPKCYHQLGKSSISQPDNVSGEVSGALFDELMSEDEDEDEGEVVDWSRHAFEIDDVTIAVDQYEDGSEDVSVSQDVSMDAFIADVPGSSSSSDDLEEGEFELTASDAPEAVEKFHIPDSNELDEEFVEPTHKVDLVVPLLPSGANEETDDDALIDPSEVPDEEEGEPETETLVESEPTIEPTPEPATPEPATPEPVAQAPALPSLPTQPSVATQNGAAATTTPAIPVPSTPTLPTTPALPPTPTAAATPQLPTPPPSRPEAGAFQNDLDLDVEATPATQEPTPVPNTSDTMWPWPQKEDWDDLTVRRELRQVMEKVKAGDIAEATRAIDALGPHLGDRKEILFHVGVVLKKLGRDAALQNMLETARRLYPEDKHVATALTSLGMS